MNILTGNQNYPGQLDLAVAYRDGHRDTILGLSIYIKTLACIFVIVALSVTAYGTTYQQRESTFALHTVSSARAVTTEPVYAQVQAQCNPRTGLSAPLGLCTSERPCKSQEGRFIVSAIDRPTCTTVNPRQPVFRDGSPRAWIDDNRTLRYACVFQPAGASRESPRPLVLWLHGGLGAADDVYNYTLLRQKAAFFDLSGDPSRPGFILASIQGRNIHYPTGLPPGSREGPHHDIYFRDLRTNTANPDLQYYDHLVDAFVAEGVVDPQRIYVMGWSNGGFMAQMYAIARFVTPTPEGNHVAAAAVFGAADPFNNTSVDQRPSCQLNPYPQSNVGIYLIQRSCDAACACSPAQMARFSTPPGYNLVDWISTLKNEMRNPNVVLHLIDDNGNPTASCDDGIRCRLWWGRRRGLINHLRWPDGVADGSGRDWEVGMLEFLKRSPHP